jgi:hypothetical protein
MAQFFARSFGHNQRLARGGGGGSQQFVVGGGRGRATQNAQITGVGNTVLPHFEVRPVWTPKASAVDDDVGATFTSYPHLTSSTA